MNSDVAAEDSDDDDDDNPIETVVVHSVEHAYERLVAERGDPPIESSEHGDDGGSGQEDETSECADDEEEQVGGDSEESEGSEESDDSTSDESNGRTPPLRSILPILFLNDLYTASMLMDSTNNTPATTPTHAHHPPIVPMMMQSTTQPQQPDSDGSNNEPPSSLHRSNESTLSMASDDTLDAVVENVEAWSENHGSWVLRDLYDRAPHQYEHMIRAWYESRFHEPYPFATVDPNEMMGVEVAVRAQPASQVQLDRLVRYLMGPRTIPPPREPCSICQEGIGDSNVSTNVIRFPDCHHEFHNHCILSWLAIRNACPLCRIAL